MGQRHQAFLIARIRASAGNGNSTYRCVGGFHHQWCYGSLPLKAAHRFITLLGQEMNAAVVQGELRQLEATGKSSSELDPQPDPMPCPYTVALLGHAWTTDMEDQKYLSGHIFGNAALNADMGCWDGDNDDGLSVFDITDPVQPKYCFLHPDDWNRPLSAYEYLSHYYNLAEPEKEIQNSRIEKDELLKQQVRFFDNMLRHILRLAGIPLISSETLHTAWPSEQFVAHGWEPAVVPMAWDEQTAILATAHASLNVQDFEAYQAAGRDEADRKAEKLAAKVQEMPKSYEGLSVAELSDRWSTIVTFLRAPGIYEVVFVSPDAEPPSREELELETCIQHYCDDEKASMDDIDLTSMPSVVKRTLSAMSPLPPRALNLLIASLSHRQERHFLDLAGFDLSVDQIIQVISHFPETQSLDISGAPRILADDIPDILEASPKLLRLIVMGCPSVEGDRLLALVRERPWSFRTIEGILHPALLTIPKPKDFPIAFTLIYADEEHLNGVAIPFFTPNLILQALSDLLSMAWDEQYLWSVMRRVRTPGILPTLSQGAGLSKASPMLLFTLFAAGALRPGERWSQRPVVSVPLQPHAVVSDHPAGSWAFFLDWAPLQARSRWGFIHYVPDDSQNEQGSCSRRRGQVYGLRDFLRCMQEEGRPSADLELVERVEKLLYAQHGADGILISPLMEQDDVPEIETAGGSGEQPAYLKDVPGWMQRNDVTGALQDLLQELRQRPSRG